jgi:uncharacterized membrane protein
MTPTTNINKIGLKAPKGDYEATVKFDASGAEMDNILYGSYDLNGDNFDRYNPLTWDDDLEFTWDFGDGSGPVKDESIIYHTYIVSEDDPDFSEEAVFNKEYSVILTVTDAEGLNSQYVITIDIEFTPPETPMQSDTTDSNNISAAFIASVVIIVVVVVVIIAVVVIMVIMMNRRKKREAEEEEPPYPGPGHDNWSHPSDGAGGRSEEMISQLRREMDSEEKPSSYGMSDNEMLLRSEERYRRGEISREAYESIRDSLER